MVCEIFLNKALEKVSTVSLIDLRKIMYFSYLIRFSVFRKKSYIENRLINTINTNECAEVCVMNVLYTFKMEEEQSLG